MNAEELFAALLSRIANDGSGAALVAETELQQWPSDVVAALKAEELLKRSRPASSVVCPGCEQQCFMAVHAAPGRSSGRAFIVCDKRDDINRVAVTGEQLRQWRCDGEAVARFVAGSLGMRRSKARTIESNVVSIGMLTGDTRTQMLCLRLGGDALLVAGGETALLAELVCFGAVGYEVDIGAVRRLVDDATTADSRYIPSEARREAGKQATQSMYDAWRREYRDVRERRPHMSKVWYAQQIAKSAAACGRSADTIRKHMTK